jgi:TPR repeat protein
MLGAMYGDGTGVPKDEQQAVFWYRKAADQGDAVAQYNLGVMYANGTGVPKDEQHAYFWFLLASAQGFSAAVTNRYILEKLLTPQQREEAQRQARTWKPSK